MGCGGCLVICIIVIIVIVVISTLSGGGTSKSSQPSIQTETESSAYMLAALETGQNNPSVSAIKIFEELLVKLQRKCPDNSELEIANYIFKGQKLIKENGGGTMKLLDFGNALNESISDELAGVLSCAEVSAALITLIISE